MAKLKRNYIQLVENPKAEEIKMETFLTPHFIPMDVLYEATDIMAELERVESGEVEMSFKEQLDKLIDVVVKIYGGQFTAKDVKARLHAPDAVTALQRQVEFIANGQQDEETKKVYSEHQLNQLDEDDLTYSSMLNHLDIVVRDLVKEGKDVNEVLKMPYHYVLQILDERNTNKVTSDAKADAIFANF